MINGGSTSAINFINKYSKTGHVIDFYSDSYFENDSIKNKAISRKYLKQLDEKYGDSYRGHLLVIYIGDLEHNRVNELANLYLPIHRYFNLDMGHAYPIKPSFLILNLFTKEILCIGIGRKNRKFSFELHNYLSKHTTLDEPYKHKIFSLPDISVECSSSFYELDYWNLAKKIDNAMESLALGYENESKREILNATSYLRQFAHIEDIWENRND